MASIAEVIRQRKLWLRKLREPVRETQTAAIACLRELDRVIKRKKTVPEPKDLNRLLSLCNTVITENQDVIIELSRGYPM